MIKSKALIGALFICGAIAVYIPLFLRDRNQHTNINAQNINQASALTMGAVAGDVLGTYGGVELKRSELSPEEGDKLFKGELQYYNAIEEVITQRYLDKYFADLASQRKLKSSQEAQELFFREKVSVSKSEVEKFLNENKENPGLQRIPENERYAKVYEFMLTRAQGGVVKSLVDEALSRGEIQVKLPKPQARRHTIPETDAPYLGAKNAIITIVEFADFQCPYCARMVPTLTELVKKYDGKLKWVYRDFPLIQIHPEAMPAAIAARCAGAQGKYFEMHGKLFDNYSKLSSQLYLQLARDMKLDIGKFENCLKDPSIRTKVIGDMDAGRQYGVDGTPSYFVNGKKVPGGMNVAEFSKVIDEELGLMNKK